MADEQQEFDLSVNTQVADALTTQTVNLLRFSAGQQGKIVDMLKDLEQELLAAIEKNVGKSTFTAGRLNALLKQTRETIATTYEKISDKNEKDNQDVAQVSATKAVGALNTAIGADVASVEWTDAQLKSIADNTIVKGHFTADWWDKQGEGLQDRFTQEMQMGLLRGETNEQLQARIRGTAENGYTDGIMEIPKNQAEALVRTSAQSVANQARMEAYKSNDGVIKGVQWMATLDDRTTPECMALDGLEWEFPDGNGDADYVEYLPVGHDKEFEPPPIHWNCRSVAVPVTYSWEELTEQAEDGDTEAAELADEVPEGTRASMDGQVAASTTFEDWLGTKPEGFQNEVLGEAQADMWRSGAIDLKGLTDQSNNPLTLEQLQAKAGEPVAEEKAKTEPLLTTEIRSKVENPSEGSNPSFEITFADGNKAMFKPEEGESAFHLTALFPAPIVAVPNAQAVADAGIVSMATREVANSDIAKMVGMQDLVPNSVMRTIDGQAGSLQQFAIGSSDSTSFKDGEQFGKHPEDIGRAAAWDYFTGNLDRHDGNWMVNDATGKMTLIDNGISFGEMHGRGAPNSDLIDKAVEDQHKVPEAVKEWVEKWPQIEKYMEDKGFTEGEVRDARERLHTLASNDNFADVFAEGEAQRVELAKAEQAAAGFGAGAPTPSELEAAQVEAAAKAAEKAENARIDAEIEAMAARDAEQAEKDRLDALLMKIGVKPEPPPEPEPPPTLPEPEPKPPPPTIDLQAPIKSQVENASSGVNTSYVLELEGGGKAIFKPVTGEDAGLQTRLGVNEGTPTMAAREAANSGVAKMLDFDLVPNTEMRWEGGTKEGSVQEMVQGYKNATEFNRTELYQNFGGIVTAEDHARAAAWDYFTGQADRHDENWMVHPSTGKVALIDNGLSFTQSGAIESSPLKFAKNFDLPIPPEVKEWHAKWPEVKTYLEEKGFTPIEIERTQFRLDELASRETFLPMGTPEPYTVPERPAPAPPPEPPPPAAPEPPALPDLEQPIKTIAENQSGGVNTSYRIEFEDGGKAIFKPIAGEELVVTQDGKPMAAREVAASDIAKILEIDEVPHTVMTSIEGETPDVAPTTVTGGEGSMQEMLEGYRNAGEFEVKERYDLIGPEAHGRMAAFDYLINNGDRHDNNWMINEATGKAGMIDNGYSMSADPTAFNSRPFGWAAHLELPIPAEVATEWTSKWPEIEVYLRTKGFDTKEIENAAQRLNDLADATTFKNVLPPDSLAYRVNEMMRQVQDKAFQEQAAAQIAAQQRIVGP